jgi:hypothetical protein
MVKIVKFLIFLTLFLKADFTTNCLACHIKKNVDLRKTFMSALLVYGGENNFKTALFYYCKNPQPMTSVMSEEFLKKYLPLKPIQIDDMQLKANINEYWNRYKIKGNLK